MIDVDKEVNRCIGCGICSKSCPCGIDPKVMIELYKAKKINDLVGYLYSKNPFSGVCGYICPNRFCMRTCIRGRNGNPVDIKGLQATFAEQYFNEKIAYENHHIFDTSKSFAIIGAGVSGLSTAWFLSHLGCKVDIYEKSPFIGGELWMIPKDRIPAKIIFDDVKHIVEHENVTVYTSSNLDVEKAISEYDLVIDCSGSEANSLEGIDNTITYKDYLNQEDVKVGKDKLAVIGGGEVALDCALVNEGSSTIFVRRNVWDMRIEESDYKKLYDKKVRVLGNFIVKDVQIDENGFKKVIGDFNGNHYEEIFDEVVVAIGSHPTETIEGTYKINPSKSVVETVANVKQHIDDIINKVVND